MKVKEFAFLAIWILILGACSPLQTPVTDQFQPTPAPIQETEIPPVELTSTPDLPGISPDQVRNAEYQLGLDQVRTVQLTNSRYQEGTPGATDYISVFVTEHIARGDLNGDGENEAVVLVTENYGGTGTFVFLTIFQYVNEEPLFLTSIYLDDRPQINALGIENGEIFVDAIIHSKDDPSCCPSLETTRHYLLNGVNLILTNYSTKTPAGDPRVITIEAPVNGAQVSGVIRLTGNITISPFENNLIYRVYDLGGVELTVGPVDVDAPILGGLGSFEKAVDLGNILTNTTVRITVEDLNVADGTLFALDSIFLQIR